ncbi:hypothetical protein J7E87_18895 [Streptomyces sp. ISL-1]|uniref:hypothetical protein n=1 Tax=Streptomyces sp. ISL-1 TaxID=2817657 RepID=UPI001BE65702|nr:hypothetical protein [Streptomyces sp. ISL-1]MBT2391447.1 hypothetical protein [Streptomyces sp. ISL-1]
MREEIMGDHQVSQRLLDMARAARGPRALSEGALRSRFGDPDKVEVAVGQVWRARWEDVSVPLLLLAVDAREVHAVPVTIDPSGEDERALVVDASQTAFGVEVTAWVSLADRVGLGVLDRPLDAWGDGMVQWVQQAVRGKPGPAPAGTRAGRAVSSAFDPSADVRAALADDLARLQQAPRLPVQETGRAVQGQGLAALLKDQPPDLALLIQVLGMSQAEVMDLLRGKVPLRPDQVDALAEATGIEATKIAGAVRPLPLDLVSEAEHPRLRPVWIRRAQQLKVSEAQARMTDAYGAFALAARETGGQTNWGTRLRHYVRDQERAGDDS